MFAVNVYCSIRIGVQIVWLTKSCNSSSKDLIDTLFCSGHKHRHIQSLCLAKKPTKTKPQDFILFMLEPLDPNRLGDMIYPGRDHCLKPKVQHGVQRLRAPYDWLPGIRTLLCVHAYICGEFMQQCFTEPSYKQQVFLAYFRLEQHALYQSCPLQINHSVSSHFSCCCAWPLVCAVPSKHLSKVMATASQRHPWH